MQDRIKEILGNDVRFNKHFDRCFKNLKVSQQMALVSWVEDCKEYRAPPILSKKDKGVIGFVSRIGSNIRAVLIKKRSGYFVELFLDKHKYYEAEMDKWGF